ncbi:cellulose biosynthesis protein BcsE [Psychromonas aquimarina]|uniref:cellulose biosynthesis protein BcsE n=1 Tax=Psychromonas aquimarina TaxID=444919 RepID=UPI0003F62F38|nr:cellulose biosynthesis protein BcsE [Psychromonas aquimarina]
MSAIQGLTPLTQNIDISRIYVTLFASKQLAVDYFSSLSVTADNITLASITDKINFYSGLKNNSRNNLTNKSNINSAYFLSKKTTRKSISLLKMIDDLALLKLKPNTTFTLFIPDTALSNSGEETVIRFLSKAAEMAKEKTITIVMLIYGPLTSPIIKPMLLTNNQDISGVASLRQSGENSYSYYIDFWSNSNGVKSETEFTVCLNKKSQFEVQADTSASAQAVVIDKADNDRIFMSETVLDNKTAAAKHVITAADNSALIAQLTQPRASTIILSCETQDEVRRLAVQCYQLRRQAGNQLKIIIRERKQCLRYTDERFLLQAGVNLIVPYNVSYARFVGLVDAVQGQVLMRPLPDSLEELQQHDHSYGMKGYLPNQEFAGYCKHVISRSAQTRIQFALVKLALLPGMTAGECLRLCHIRRDGDVITACEDSIYVLFTAVRHNDVETALNNIFEFSAGDLFRSFTAFDNLHDIETELLTVVEKSIEVSNEVEGITTQHTIFSSQPAPAAEAPLFAVRKKIQVR